MKLIFRRKTNPVGTLDLHGLHVPEAVRALAQRLRENDRKEKFGSTVLGIESLSNEKTISSDLFESARSVHLTGSNRCRCADLAGVTNLHTCTCYDLSNRQILHSQINNLKWLLVILNNLGRDSSAESKISLKYLFVIKVRDLTHTVDVC